MAKSPLDVRLYRSSVKGRRPQPADMAYGDLAVNYNHEDPALIIKGDDNALIEFKPGAGSGVKVSATAPANPKDGDLWWDTTSARLFLRYTSGTPAVSTWVDASPAAVPPALANALTYKGTVDPTAAGSAPASPKVGDTYVASKAGAIAAGWTGLTGSTVTLHELLVWDGTEWDGAGTAASPRTAWQGTLSIEQPYPAGYTPVAGDIVKFSYHPTPGPYVIHADWKNAGVTDDVSDIYDTWIFDGTQWGAIGPEVTPDSIIQPCLTHGSATDFTQPKPAGFASKPWTVYQNLGNGTLHSDYGGFVEIYSGDLVIDLNGTWLPVSSRLNEAIFRGVVDVAAAKTRTYRVGDSISVMRAGAVHASWIGITAPAVKGAIYFYDGSKWEAIGGGGGATPATTTAAGTVQLADAAAVTAGTAGRVVDAAQLKADKFWSRTGTTVSPEFPGDVVEFSAGAAALPGLTPAGDADTGAWAPAPDAYAISTGGVERIRWDAKGTTVPSLQGAETANVVATKDGVLQRRAIPFTWDANDDSYTRTPVADRDISVQARMRRCLVTDVGLVTYLDADDSTKLAGDWVRLCETTELSKPYEGTHGPEIPNTGLRATAVPWAGTGVGQGALVLQGGFAWECVSFVGRSTPSSGTAPATLDGTAGQVMVEIPLFSIRHVAPKTGAYRRHELSVALGVVEGGGYVVHPAFVKPDGSLRQHFYIGAYQGTGIKGRNSASGVDNATNFPRPACRASTSSRAHGWHIMSYYQYSALAALLFSEYQDFNSSRCLGMGATTDTDYVCSTGLSNARGNRSENAYTFTGSHSNYISYRGIENIYGRAMQWVDGLNINEQICYLSGDPASFADNTSNKYTAYGIAPDTGIASYIRDLKEGPIFIPESVTGASDRTFTGDRIQTGNMWRTPVVGGFSAGGARAAGMLCMDLVHQSNSLATDTGTRVAYSPD